jgi:hypothetical protein
MAARTNRTGEWCSPTREITSSRLIRLIDESRHRAAAAERIHDAPTRQSPAAAVERLERAHCNSMLVDLRALGDPDAPAIAEEVAAPDPGLPTLRSESETEEEATLMYTPNAMPPTAASAQSIATGARRGRKRVANVRLLLCLGVLVFLCLGVLVVLGLDTWGVTDASIHASLGL